MKTEIMFAILLTLLNKRKVSGEYLAEKFEISTRTVMRHIESLCNAGIPIVAVRGVGGGYMIADDFRLERSFLPPKKSAAYSHVLTPPKTLLTTKLICL